MGKNKGGRPPEPVPQIFADEVIAWISSGKCLREYCRQEGKPVYSAVYAWIEKDKEFEARFARARDIGHDVIAEEAAHIANTPCVGEIVTETTEGSGDKAVVTKREVRKEDMLGHRKLQVWTRLQLLAKWNPKKYGDKVAVEKTETTKIDHTIIVKYENMPQKDLTALLLDRNNGQITGKSSRQSDN